MNTQDGNSTYYDARGEDVFPPAGNAALFDGIVSRRVFAFFIDYVVIAVLLVAAYLVMTVVGILTLGLGFILMPPLALIVILGYFALTLGGRNSATIGMKMLGIEMRFTDGRKMNPIMAMFHAVLFWFFNTILTPFIVLIALFSSRGRMLHDMIIGVVTVNSEALHANK